MTETSGVLSLPGILSLAAIVAGIVLLVVYAVRRGMFTRELDGTDEEAAALAADDPTAAATPRVPRRANAGRPVGILGAILLVGGVLGMVVAATTATPGQANQPPGATGQEQCAAGWDGCPKATPQP